MRPASIIAHAFELYAAAVDPAAPADRVAARYYRTHRYLGSHDRAAIDRIVWRLLRERVRALALDRRWRDAPPAALPEPLRHLLYLMVATASDGVEPVLELPPETTWLDALDEWAARNPCRFTREQWIEARTWVERAWSQLEPGAGDSDRAALQVGIPDWLAHELAAVHGEQWVKEAQALRGTAPVALRVNTLKATRDDVLDWFTRRGFDARPSPLAPDGIRLDRRLPLTALEPFREGWIEPQDEGSQLVALAVAPRPGERVLDACAGGGGKALHLAALLNNEGQILAADADAHRLGELARRAQRAGAACIRILNSFQCSLLSDLDAVLIDAPCSGLGAARRRPDVLFKTDPADAARWACLQADLVRRWAGAVRPGGRLVYATCTLTRIENEAVIETFLAEHPDFTPEDPLDDWRHAWGDAAPESLARGWTGLGRRLTPAQHGCDGFFIARLRRQAV